MPKHKRRNKAIDPDCVEEIDWRKSVKFVEPSGHIEILMRRCKLDDSNIHYVAEKMSERLTQVLTGQVIEKPGICDLSNNAIGCRGAEALLDVLMRFDLQMSTIKLNTNSSINIA